MDTWMEDTREIKAAGLAGNGRLYSKLVGATFERFERPGEYCMLPWLRITSPNLPVVEAPLTHVQFLEYAA